jgi:hypothetical protein
LTPKISSNTYTLKIPKLQVHMETKTNSDQPAPAHHRFGPSSLKYYELCPAWQNRLSEDTSAADEGTLLHERMEREDPCADHPGDLPLTDWQLGSLREAHRHVKPLLDTNPSTVLKEHRVFVGLHDDQPNYQNPNFLLFGTVDLVCLYPNNTAAVADYKFGVVPVDPAEVNLQGWAYAVGVFEMFPELDEVSVRFVSPRLSEPVSEHTFTRKADYERMRLRIEAVVAAASAPEPTPSPAIAACEYCGAKSDCPALAAIASSYAARHKQPLASAGTVSKRIEDMTETELAAVKDTARVLADWAYQVDRSVLYRVLEGANVPGYTLSLRRPKPKLADPGEIFKAVRDMAGVEKEDFQALLDLPVNGLRDLYARAAVEAGKHKSKAAAIREFDSEMERRGLIVYPEGEDTPFLRKVHSK